MSDAMKYGPQTAEPEALFARARAFTGTEAQALSDAWRDQWVARGFGSWDDNWNAARNIARGAAWDAARGAAWGAVRNIARDAAWGAGRP